MSKPELVVALEERMKKANIPGVSIAYVNAKEAKGPIRTVVVGKTDPNLRQPPAQVTPETPFGAASLSKPVFSYLVLKLVAARDEIPPKIPPLTGGKPFDLDTPLANILPIAEFYRDYYTTEVSQEFIEKAKTITARMILSHTSGISDSTPQLAFIPGTEFEYTGKGLIYLQKVIEKQMGGKSLETLAQEVVFGPLGMKHSTFIPDFTKPPDMKEPSPGSLQPPIGANSLETTASDYARFVRAWMRDEDQELQGAFTPWISMTKDQWAAALKVPEVDRQHLAWGLGWGLERDDAGTPITAFHTGDMNQWRGWVAMDLQTKTAVVYFANGTGPTPEKANGHVLADLIIAPEVTLEHGLNCFFQKFGFARDVEDGWQEKQKDAVALIGKYVSSRSAGSPLKALPTSPSRVSQSFFAEERAPLEHAQTKKRKVTLGSGK